jgi:hypothetical protein
MKHTELAGIPLLQEASALGLIVTCANHDCRRRRWLNLHELPKHATVLSVANNARCQACGSKGVHVEVVQPLSEIGEHRGQSGPRNIEHAARLRSYIEEHPFAPGPASGSRNAAEH